ncbi:hypothetical protein ASD94_08455 [Acidovorax sp. Root70]|nr:hypothetical protein ASD94_08455 [Acidovorax sp. Root70]
MLVVVNTKNNNNNNNNAARSAAPPLCFSEGSALSQSEKEHLENLLSYHPEGQAIVDELAGQLRARGRGPGGIRNPRALAARLAREATARGVGLWYYHLDEAALRLREAEIRHAEEPPTRERQHVPAPRAVRELAERLRREVRGVNK